MLKLFSVFIFLCAVTTLHAQTDTTLAEYKGTYKFPDGSVVTSAEVIFSNGALTITSAIGSAGLEKVSKDTFSMPSYNGSVYFSRNSDGNIEGIKVLVQDIVLEGKKESSNGLVTGLTTHYTIPKNAFDFGKKLTPGQGR